MGKHGAETLETLVPREAILIFFHATMEKSPLHFAEQATGTASADKILPLQDTLWLLA